MCEILAKLRRTDQDGQGLVEYSFLLTLVALVVAGALTSVGQAIVDSIQASVTALFG